MKTIYIRNILLLGIVGLLFHVSCKKEDFDLQAPRIFRPIPQFDNSIENTLIIYFKANEEAKLYEADISQDSLFQEIEQSITISPDTADYYYNNTRYTSIRFDNLLAAQAYFIRVKAIHPDSTMNSKYYEFKATTQTIFVNPTSNEILDVAFKAKWDVKGDRLTKITITLAEDDSFVKNYWVFDSENKSGVKVIDGLNGNTTYNVYLYSRDRLRGKGTVTTKTPVEGNIVDLRFMESNTALWDTIQNVESGATVLLKRGQTYIFPSARTISGSITVMSGYDFVSELAVLQLNGNAFRTPMNTTIDEIVFKDVNINSDYGGASYIFFQEEKTTIKKFMVENVRSHGHRGFFRVGADVSVDSLIIYNCVIDSLREYGITHISGENANLKNISIKNSTFYHVVRPFFNSSSAVNSSNTITIENCTFYHTPDGGRFFFDYDGGTKVTIKDCIFGAQLPIYTATAAARGYRENTIDLTMSGCYGTNDFVLETGVEGSIPLEPNPYNGSSADLFEDPENHNFKIIDSGFSGRETAGDPRWR